jgi:hypothetical protein
MLDLSQGVRTSTNLIPGFDAQVQGIYREADAGWINPLLYLRDAGMTALGWLSWIKK